jgi:hypothetical protein
MKALRKMIENNAVPSAIFTLFLLLSGLGLGSCRVEQTEEGEMPDVDVQVEGGELPEYDVDAADVDVGTEEVEVTVPDIDVDMPEEGDPADDEGEVDEPPVQ